MIEQPLDSVLMTAYNREKYIAEAIKSVLASTYQNWELITVDDCSKDTTVEIGRFDKVLHYVYNDIWLKLSKQNKVILIPLGIGFSPETKLMSLKH